MTGAILTGREVHPVIPLLPPEVESADPKKAEEYYGLRKELMERELNDPARFGYKHGR